MRLLTYLLITIVVLMGVTFASLNAAPVKLNYYIGTAQVPLSLLLVLVLGLGILIGLLVTATSYLRIKKLNYKLKNKVKVFEKEIENLRALPVRNEH